jgi:FkbM family methyltransferase
MSSVIQSGEQQAATATMDPDLVIDVGMHRGEDTEFYLKKGYRVVAIEANPALCEECEAKFRSSIRSGQLVIVNKAIGERTGPVSFYVNQANSVWGTINAPWVTRNRDLYGAESREITVDAARFESILKQYGIPYYLKVDIEGSDLLCLQALRLAPAKPLFVSIESSIGSFEDLFDELSLLRSLGYGRYKIVAQHNVPFQKPPFPSREKAFAEHRFAEGASGLFGRELPGNWLPLEATLLQYRKILNRHKIVGDRNIRSRLMRSMVRRMGLSAGWYDTHAMLGVVR